MDRRKQKCNPQKLIMLIFRFNMNMHVDILYCCTCYCLHDFLLPLCELSYNAYIEANHSKQLDPQNSAALDKRLLSESWWYPHMYISEVCHRSVLNVQAFLFWCIRAVLSLISLSLVLHTFDLCNSTFTPHRNCTYVQLDQYFIMLCLFPGAVVSPINIYMTKR